VIRQKTEEKEVIMKYYVVLLLTITCGMVYAQKTGEPGLPLSPEQIDIYSFDPSAQAKESAQSYVVKANEAYNKKDYEAAARFYLAYLQYNPEEAGSWYNLSCCYGLLGMQDLAAKYLLVAYKKGFSDLEHIKQDVDFALVKESSAFSTALDSLQIWTDKKAYYLGKMEYFPATNYLPYWIHLPKDYDAGKEYTLLIGMHGFGDKAYAFTNLWKILESDKVIFVVPEAPYPFVDGNTAGFSWNPFVSLETPFAAQAYNNLSTYICELTKSISKQHKVQQTWLLGFSQGAYLGYMLSIKNPKVFDGLIACGGGLVTEAFKDKDYKKAKNLKIIISHGLQDKVVPYEESQKAFDLLKAKGLNVTLDSFEGAHSINKELLKTWLGGL
jgi:predicted esterase